MLYLQLFNHHFKEFFRNKFWRENIAMKILAFVGFLLISGEFIALGWFCTDIIGSIKPNENVIKVFSSWILFYFLIEFIFRFLIQHTPLLKIQPYLHLNISKSQLIHFLLIKSILSYSNLLYLAISIPFGFRTLLLKEQYFEFTSWVIVSLISVFTFNFLAQLVKRTFGVHLISTLATIGIIGLLVGSYLMNWIDLLSISQFIFNSGIVSILLLSIVLIILYWLNFKLQLANIYIKETTQSWIKLDFIDNLLKSINLQSVESELIITDLKLILRNKRTRIYLALPIFFYGVGFIMPETNIEFNNKYQFLIMSMVLLQMNFGQVLPSWESAYFDGLMTKNLSFKTYLRAKFILLIILASFGLIPLIFTLFININLFIGGLCVVIYAIGANSIAFLGISNHNNKRMEINESAWFKGSNNGNMIYMFFVTFLPFLIYLPFMLLKWHLIGAYVLAGIGVFCLIFHNQFLKEFELKYRESKFKLLEGFRTK
ncbi:MAG: DUF5687 family protein [Bacteroidota bacterium]|nr:DUF5687 family protein [Bacteroidota bacterium]